MQQAPKDRTTESITGLTTAQVQQRVASGNVNVNTNVKTRSYRQIFRANILTLFNAINVVLAAFVLYTGSYKNALFMLIILLNVAIGILQEIRSKIATDNLSIVVSADATVIRNGQRANIPVNQLVRDDIIFLGRGDQIPADSIVVSGTCDVDESLLTGESDAVHKAADSTLMSGSFITAGTVYARVEHVGAENYAAQISAEAKQHKKINSEIMDSLNGIIKYVSILLAPIGIALFARTYLAGEAPVNGAILSTVAALIGMIPEGLILLTSTVLAVAVIRLAQQKVLVQQLYCIETLARVDTLCLDKTGTITTGHMEMDGLVLADFTTSATTSSTVQAANTTILPATLNTQDPATQTALLALQAICQADEDPNETSLAIKKYVEASSPATATSSGASSSLVSALAPALDAAPTSESIQVTRYIPFSSDKKWSGATLKNGNSYVMGAAQFILKEDYSQIEQQAKALSQNYRTILLAQVLGFTENGDIQGTPTPLAFACLHDEIRPTAKQTINYFTQQGVTVIVISGDDPRTVSGIAQKVQVPNAEKFIDATTLTTQEQVNQAIKEYCVFGRVRPEQKKEFVQALQTQQHVVAMTGDGVNDTLALKQADCSVAMASGSDAARNVAQLVLVDNDFASMPKVVAEGRRSINNLQRSASLFLVKTLLSMTLAVLFIILPWQYPFQPIQMTLISAFTIGLPSFVLALEPNHDRITGHFLRNVIVRSIPGAIVDVLGILAFTIMGNLIFDLTYEEISTLCVLFISFVGVLLIIKLSIPFTPIRIALLIVTVAGLALGSTLFAALFNITVLTQQMWVMLIAAAVVATALFLALYNTITSWYASRNTLSH